MEQEPSNEVPKEFEDKPELVLAWRGLTISISEGVMTRRRAYEMLASWDHHQECDSQNE